MLGAPALLIGGLVFLVARTVKSRAAQDGDERAPPPPAGA